MTPKEKAIELVARMSFSKAKVADYETGQMVDVPGNIYAKQCALIAVDEICEILEDNGFTFIEYHDRTTIEYWLQVKQEIEKL
jgi:hypothetical protein